MAFRSLSLKRPASPTGVETPQLAVLDRCPDAALATGPDGSVVYCNPAAEGLLRVEAAELVGNPLGAVLRLTARDAGGRFPERAWAETPAGRRIPVEAVRWAADVQGLPVQVTVLRDSQARVDDEVAQATLTERLRQQARVDPLTGLANRFELVERAAELIADELHWLAAVVVDVDGFKAINDVHGHGVGDEVLIAFASRLRGGASPGQTVARLGGDEFVVLSHSPPRSSPEHLVRQVEAAVEGDVATTAGPLRVTSSIGGAVSPPGETVSDVIRRADKAMYRRKLTERDADLRDAPGTDRGGRASQAAG